MSIPFPYCLIGVTIKPIIGEIQKTAPFYLSLAVDSPFKGYFENSSQKEFNEAVFNDIHPANDVIWSVGSYLENRSVCLRDYPQMMNEKRYYHLGIDINVRYGSPLYAPLDGEIVESFYEAGDGNYGGLIVMKCCCNGTTFYILLGHLQRATLPAVGTKVKAGQQVAVVGDLHENGNWYEHTHLQVLTEKGYAEGWVNKGYCTLEDIPTLEQYAPNPLALLIV